MRVYDWKESYGCRLVRTHESDDHRKYHLENETGTGTVTEWMVFPGVQVLCNDLHMEQCASTIPLREGVIEISYCIEGGYVCNLGDKTCFITGSGELSVGAVGRTERHGGFPTGRYYGITVFVDTAAFTTAAQEVLRDLKIDLQMIRQLTGRERRRFILRVESRVDAAIRDVLEKTGTEEMLPLLKIKTLELLMILSEPGIRRMGTNPSCINRTHAKIAAEVERRITEDLAGHVTIRQLERDLQISSTAIKTAFKAVYGISPYAYFKNRRLDEAQRLLRETTLPVAEIGQRIGYMNPGKFSSAFRERFGATPTAYRNEVRSVRSREKRKVCVRAQKSSEAIR